MITLGKNQEKILKTLEGGKYTLEELSEKSGVKLQTVKNIITEYHDAEIVKKSEDKYYSLREAPLKPKNTTGEESFWAPVRLKNLSRIV